MSGDLYVARGLTLALAWLMACNVASTAVVVAVARRMLARRDRRSPALWLALRLGPAIVSLAFVAFVFLPSYWRYEPHSDAGEGFDLTLTVLAAGAAAVIALGVLRATDALWSAWRRARGWRRVSRPLEIGHASIPAFAVEIEAPIMALVGVLRPRLLVTRGVLDALTADELRAGVAHELGHRRAFDNLKRLAMRAAPDLLFPTSTAAAIEARWASAAEHAADRLACADDSSRCALASALVKIARLTPPRTPLAQPISTLVDGGEIASRVEHLLSCPAPDPAVSRTRLAAGVSMFAAVAAYTPLLRLVHEATEILVRTLP
jgi:Zn-dependent protease with chaperone function